MSSNRWSRQVFPTTPSSLTAAQSSQERSERRLSRLSPSDFDSILSSDGTLQLAGAGRDENTLGQNDGEAVALSDHNTLASTSATPHNPPPNLPPAEMGSEKQSGGRRDTPNAPSTDLSPARRRSEAQAALAFAAVEGKGKGKAEPSLTVEELPRDEMEPPPTPTKDHSSLHPLTPTRSRTSHPAIFSTPTSASSSRRPSAAEDVPTPSYTKLSMPADLAHPAERAPSSSSYVHVERPSDDRPSRGVQYDSVASLGLPDVSPKRRKGSVALGAGIGGGLAPEESRGTFSNTMRRTSRFFRKLGGGSTPPPAFKTAPSTTSRTPIANAFSSPSRAPPAPALSSSSPSDRRPSAVSSASTSSKQNADLPSPPRRSSIDIAIHSPAASPSRAPSSTHLARGGSAQSLSPKDARRRSLSLSSASAAAAGLTRLNSAGSDRSNRRGATRAPKHSPNKSEEERLKRELQHWKLDMDGVLGSIGEPSTGSTRTATAVSTPMAELSGFAPIEAAHMGRSTSTPPRRPTWADDWSAGVGITGAQDDPRVTQRSASLPTSSLSPLPPLPKDESPDHGQIDQPALGVKDDSSVELLATPTMGQGEQSDSSTSPATPLPPPIPDVTTEELSSPAEGEHGLGLGLPTITESGHSRDSSLATPTKEALDSTPRRMAATEGTSIPPFVLTESPSTPAPPPPVIKLSNQRNKAARQSVVTYPSASSSTTRNSLPGSKNASSTSLASDPQRHEGRGQPLGETLEDQARDAAKRCWDEDVTFSAPKKIAEWLGSPRPVSVEALRVYIDFFDFTGLRLDLSFRRLCNKLYLKAETQQVDRILARFSQRYWNNNPTSVYGSADVVHAVSYSLLLLNTDLHVVDSDRRMTRNQFVRNTLSAISMQQDDPEPGTTPALLFQPSGARNDSDPTADGVFGGGEAAASKRSLDKAMSRNGSVVSWNTSSPNLGNGSPQLNRDSPHHSQLINARSESTMTVNSSGSGSRSTDVALEVTLKDMYNAVKSAPIFQPHSSSLDVPESHSRSSLSLTPNTSPYATWSGVNRSASRRSATSTLSGSSNAYKRSSVRGFGNFLGTSSSMELARSGSPTPSTATSLTDDNFSTAYGASSHHHVPTIGFANSLSHTIIREQQEDDTKSDDGVSISDEELALLGAPWAKEGILQRKHYWESLGKRAKEKGWLQAFIVVSAGELRMFRFDGAGSTRGTGGGMGGGDWTSTANSVGEVSLTHALCSAMPPPGYSKDRPHCFVLTLPDNGSYFFQAGTQDLVTEWVSTCNYWSARLSKEPLPGGVSNMEYGWNRVTPSKLPSEDDRADTMSVRSSHSRMSYQAFGHDRRGSNNSNDSLVVADWKAPNHPLGASSLSEDAQLENLKRHVAIIKAELAHHNTLRAPMTKLYSARSVNLAKASANWERKSQYLLAEIVKYQTYIEALTSAIKLRALKRGQKEVEQMLDDDDEVIVSPTDGPGVGAFAIPSPQRSPHREVESFVDSETDADGEAEPAEGEAGPTRLSILSVTTTDDDVFLDAASQGPTPAEQSPHGSSHQ